MPQPNGFIAFNQIVCGGASLLYLLRSLKRGFAPLEPDGRPMTARGLIVAAAQSSAHAAQDYELIVVEGAMGFSMAHEQKRGEVRLPILRDVE